MQAAGRIEDQVAGILLDRVGTVRGFDGEFAAVVFVGFAEEDRRGQVGAQQLVRPVQRHDRIVHVRPVSLPGGIPAECRGQDFVGQGRGEKPLVSPETGQQLPAQPGRGLGAVAELLVRFDPPRLSTGNREAVRRRHDDGTTVCRCHARDVPVRSRCRDVLRGRRSFLPPARPSVRSRPALATQRCARPRRHTSPLCPRRFRRRLRLGRGRLAG